MQNETEKNRIKMENHLHSSKFKLNYMKWNEKSTMGNGHGACIFFFRSNPMECALKLKFNSNPKKERTPPVSSRRKLANGRIHVSNARV